MRLSVTENQNSRQAVLNAVGQLPPGEASLERIYSLLNAWGTDGPTVIRAVRELEAAGTLWKDGNAYRRGPKPAPPREAELVLQSPDPQYAQRTLF
jgi:hypothetical protein